MFDAHKVNFDLVVRRNERFKIEEKKAMERWQRIKGESKWQK